MAPFMDYVIVIEVLGMEHLTDAFKYFAHRKNAKRCSVQKYFRYTPKSVKYRDKRLKTGGIIHDTFRHYKKATTGNKI